MRGSRKIGFELKRTTRPRITASMRSALETLDLERLDLIHAGDERVRAVPLRAAERPHTPAIGT